MLKISIRPQCLVHAKDQAALPLHRVLELLAVVANEGNLRRGARRLGISYRHAWGIVRAGDGIFGAPLLQMSRGRGAILTAMGEKLLWADKRIAARLAPVLDSLASELEAEIERVRSDCGAIIRIHASHGFALELLRDFLAASHIPVEVKYRGSMEALASLAGSNCEIGGFHVPLGELQAASLKFYAKWLRPGRQTLISVATRRQGIMLARGNPQRILSHADLARRPHRFVNRQFGSGTRILLDLLLKRENVDSRRIHGYDTSESTHSAVAACIASGMADAGFGVETAARQMNLDFIPIASERYFLICPNESIDSPTVARIREVLSSARFRAAASGLPGIDATQAGTTLSIRKAFPDLPAAPRRARCGRPAMRVAGQ